MTLIERASWYAAFPIVAALAFLFPQVVFTLGALPFAILGWMGYTAV